MWPGQAEGRHRRGGHSRQGGVCREQHRPETAVQRHGGARRAPGPACGGRAQQAAQSSSQSRPAAAPTHRAARPPARPAAALRLHWLPWQQDTERVRPSADTVLLGQVGAQDFITRMPPGLAAERGARPVGGALCPREGATAQTPARRPPQAPRAPRGFLWRLRALRCVWGPRSSVPWARGVPSPPQTRLRHDTGPWGQGATWGSPLPLPTDGHQGGLSALGFRVQREHQAPHSPWSLPGTGKSREMGGKGREDTAAGSRLSGSWVAEPRGGGASAPDPAVCAPQHLLTCTHSHLLAGRALSARSRA